MMSNKSRGLYDKFEVRRTDGKSEPGEKHCGCNYFVLDLTHDKHALPALKSYAQALHDTGANKQLEDDLRMVIGAMEL